jgi:beta-glucanase (GH16 family)
MRGIHIGSASAIILSAGLLAVGQPSNEMASAQNVSSTPVAGAPSRAMSVPPGYTASEKDFDSSFKGTTLDPSKWNTYISDANSDYTPWNGNGAGGSGPDPGFFAVQYYDPSHVTVDNGLTITATAGSSEPGYSWTSGIVTTQGKFAFSGGYLQVKAWMPNTRTGMWPGIWLLGDQTELPEVDLYEGGFLPRPNRTFSSNLHDWVNGGCATEPGPDFAAGWNVFGIQYDPGVSITTYLNGVEQCSYTSDVPSGPYFLILDLEVMQNFDDSASWHSVIGASTPPTDMEKIAEVQAYS